MTNRFAHSRDLLLIACLAFLIYFGLALIKPSGIFWSLDEGGKWIYLENVLRTGDPRAALIYPGRELDSTLGNVPIFFSLRKGDQIYSWWPVGFPLITLPFYKLLGWGGLYLLPALGGAVIVLLSGVIAKMLSSQSRWAADTTSVLVALATPVAYYSMTFWEHTLSTACILAMAYLLLLNRQQFPWRLLLLAGILGSLGVFFRQETGLIAFGFGLVFLLASWRKAIPFAVGGFLTTAAWIAVNLCITGNILGPNGNASQAMSLFNGIGAAGLKFIPYLLFNAPLVGAFAFNKWLLAIATILAFLTALLGLWKKTRLFSALLLIATTLVCTYVLLQPALYRSVHGFILISPFILLFGWVFQGTAWQRSKTFWWMCLAGIFFFLLAFFLKAWVAAGGLQWGPRYLLALYPMMVIAVVTGVQETLQQMQRGWRKTLMVVSVLFAMLVGLGFEVRGYYTMTLTMNLYHQSGVELRALGDEVIRTECIWMPMVIPDLWWQGNIFTIGDNPRLDENMINQGRATYLSVDMLACGAGPVDQVVTEVRQRNSTLVVTRQSVNTIR